MTLAIFFISGLIIGSFLNVLVYRVSMAETILGRSYCPHCKKGIAWYDNVPLLSFILLRARCRDCQKKISWQYPLVELGTAVLFLAVGAKFFDALEINSWVETIYYLGVVSSLVVIFVYDFLYMEIPGAVLWPAIWGVIGFNLWFDWNGGHDVSSLGSLGLSGSGVYSGTLAAFSAFAFFFLSRPFLGKNGWGWATLIWSCF